MQSAKLFYDYFVFLLGNYLYKVIKTYYDVPFPEVPEGLEEIEALLHECKKKEFIPESKYLELLSEIGNCKQLISDLYLD